MGTGSCGSVDAASGVDGVSLTVIVPVYNDEQGLARCIRALENQTLAQSQFEVIIVDNGSAVVPNAPANANVRLLIESEPGSYAARNRGIEVATASIIAFTDADCIPNPEWLAEGLAYLDEHSDASSVGGHIEVFAQDADRRTPIEVYELVKAFHQDDFISDLHFAATANLFVRRSVFEAVGLFNATLKSGGDFEFGNRSISGGFRMDYSESVVVRHPARRTMRASLQKLHRTMAGMRDNASLLGQPFPYPIAGTVRNLVPPIPSIVRAFRASDIGPLIDRLKYAYALFVLHYARVVFRLWLRLGTNSPR